jgi:hypothetical protein
MDKLDKIGAIYRSIAAEVPGWDGYVFNLDADDVIHPDLVHHFLTVRSRSGYLLMHGYMYDVATDAIGFLRPRSWALPTAKPFYRHCGSSAAVRLDLRQGHGFLELVCAQKRHTQIRERLHQFGVTLREVDFPAGIYVVNHGDNHSQSVGRLQFKTRYLDRNQVPRELDREVRKTFRLDRIPASG